jgi:hypothetical protein
LKRRKIYAVMSFKAGKHPRDGSMEITEKGKIYWFRSEELARSYLDNAGKRDKDSGYRYDDPFECRWDWAMIEEVYEGPLPPPGKLVALYKVTFKKDNCVRFTKRELKKIPKWLSGSYGHTIS